MDPSTISQSITSANGILLKQTFDNVEQLIETTAEWSLDFWQLETGRFHGNMLQAITPTWQLTHAQFGRRLKQQGIPPTKLRNIVIPGSPSLQIEWRGHQVNGNSIMVFPLGGELESISNENFDVFVVAIAEEQLAQGVESLDLPELHTLIERVEVVNCAPDTMANLRSRFHYLTQGLETTPDLLYQAAFAHQIEIELIQQILKALNQGTVNLPIPVPRRRKYTIQAAEAYIHDHAYEGLTVGQICKALNISERTLRSAFCARYGIAPKAYLKRYKLTHVHRQLRMANPGATTVGAIANTWGFWHMGQFAKDYFKMFGELPSVTLTSSQRR
jgi:AraC family ethanolamine operon transcriptional activator